jgi:uncharacterized protein YlaI
MIATCVICGEDIELDIDEFIQIQDEIEDYFCDECSQRAREFIKLEQLSKN